MQEKPCLIVIGRQFGSGGREVAAELAKRLGIPYYDKALLGKAAQRYGFDENIFRGVDEKKPSMFRNILSSFYGVSSSYAMDNLSPERIYALQSDAIREICKHENCIIVGRTADHIMRNHPNLISIFVHAPLAYRARHILERGDAPTLDLASNLALSQDRQRQDYYNYFTGRNWGKASNYHLTIDSSILELDKIVDLIVTYVNNIQERSLN